jgi:hypothetical protein
LLAWVARGAGRKWVAGEVTAGVRLPAAAEGAEEDRRPAAGEGGRALEEEGVRAGYLRVAAAAAAQLWAEAVVAVVERRRRVLCD